MLINMLKKWKGYRHRFVPWIALNLKNRSKRIVEAGQEDKIVCDDVLLSVLLHLLPNLLSTANTSLSPATVAARNMKVAESVLGFCVRRATSKVPGAGVGVTVARGSVERGSLVALYPGTLYHPHEPILLPSIGNAFVLRCVDGIHVDGSDRRISKMIYKSCVRRDSVWPHQAGDLTWLTEHSAMPLSIGQYVNNHSPGFPANVAYQELNVPLSRVLPEHRCFLPNVWYSSSCQHDHLRLVALVSTAHIEEGDELFSTYYTLIL
ncbi:SET domain-containing protein 9-like isoform X2 [Zootermopsis nevadensis]|uniref:SET domain-containing protein 9 n=1 Tax=Zootermopsis nevadensis TaxID=136037 RepID=A0A067QZA9_ZOONE|nr:SET domain-containing protein 9-like isoform X2 [Zootermopsis nevadensis]KDR10407.1 hypothetical protein L798_15419 [Zootermopsis nevadensis]